MFAVGPKDVATTILPLCCWRYSLVCLCSMWVLQYQIAAVAVDNSQWGVTPVSSISIKQSQVVEKPYQLASHTYAVEQEQLLF